jgi:apolipoprotein N-acyltransferase
MLINHLTFPIKLLGALLLGMILTLSFAPYEIFPFAILSLSGLAGLLLNTAPKKAFWLGLFFGIGLFSTGIYWVFISVHLFGDTSILLATVITAAFILILALYKGSFCYIANRYFPAQSTGALIFAFPAIWVLGELIQARLFTGFPWLLVGYSQTNSPLKNIAPLLSVYGVSLAILISSTLLLNAFLAYKKNYYKTIYISLISLLCIWISSSLLGHINWTKPAGQPIPVALVQGNIPQSIKWSPEHIYSSLKRYEELTEPLWGKNKIIIWPESAIPIPLQDAMPFIDKMDQKARTSGSHLILGIPIASPDNKGYLNAVITLGNEKNSYFKRHLVPFGEYTPFEAFISRILEYLNIPMSNMLPGNLIQAPLVLNGVKILTAICYEIAFPWLNESHDQSLGLLLTVTNDAWFGYSSARAQHLQIAILRTLELGRPQLVVSNDGITAIIGTRGEIVSTIPTNQATVLTSTIQPVFGLTPWMITGSNLIMLILISLLIFARCSIRRLKSTSTL